MKCEIVLRYAHANCAGVCIGAYHPQSRLNCVCGYDGMPRTMPYETRTLDSSVKLIE